MLIIRATLLSSYSKNVAKPRYEPKDEQFVKLLFTVYRWSISAYQFANYCHTRQIHRSLLLL